MNRRLSLTTILIAVNVGLVLAAVLAVGGTANQLLRSLADTDALSRARLAGVSALQILERSGQEVATSARLLAERPTLNRLAKEGNTSDLAPFLERFARTSHLTGCAVFVEGRVAARGGAVLSWEEMPADAAGADWIIVRERPGGPLVLAAAAPAEVAGVKVLAARILDASFETEVERLVGQRVKFLAADPAPTGPKGTREGIRANAVSFEEPSTGYVEAEGAYVAVLPVRSRTGSLIGLVETSLPEEEVSAPFRDVARTLFLLSIAVLLGATVLGFVLGRRLGRPVDALTEAAERIGHGDLATPIPHATGAEIGTLSTTMEEMRLRLLHLTAELKRRRAEAEAIVTGISEGVYTVDRERRILYLNPQAAALLGVRPEDAVGRFCGDVLRPQGPGGIRPCEEHCPIVHARFRGSARATEHLVLADGTRRTMVVASAPPLSYDREEGSGGFQQFQVLRDETDIEATRRLRDTVLANISHEFKTPLSAQLASIELLQDRLPDVAGSEAVQLVSSLERGTLRLTHLIDNLLESVRIESGRDTIRRAPIALDEVIEEAVGVMGSLLAQRGQKIEVDLPHPLPPVVGDAQRLTQVFVNLLANSNKFAPEGSTVRIGGGVEGSSITLFVEDEGPGLPAGAGPALFSRFYRAPGDEPEQSGMGLGLWIVKSIVERHGGRVATRSIAKGTRILVILPVEETKAREGTA